MGKRFVPARGDIVWVSFDPQAGHEQAGRRPALVVSPRPYNAKVGLAILCPITRKVKGYPFEVAVAETAGVAGVVLADQVKSLDWRARRAALAGRVPKQTMHEVMGKLLTLLTEHTG